jgi:hypothetical protein
MEEGGLMQVEGGYAAGVMELMECVESKDDPLIQIVRARLHDTDSVLSEIVTNFNKSFQSKIKGNKIHVGKEYRRKMGR